MPRNQSLGAGSGYVYNPFNNQPQNANMFKNPQQGGGMQPGSRPGVQGGDVNAWNVVNSSGQPTGQNIPGGGVPGGGMTGGGTANGGFSMDKIIQAQLDEWNKERGGYNDAAAYMKGIPGAYNDSQTLKDTHSLLGTLMHSPEALNNQTMGLIKNKTANEIQSQTDNSLKNTYGILSAAGEADPATMAAAQERAARGGIAANENASTNLEIQRAMQRNQDYLNAIGAGSKQATADIGVPLQVGNSMLANLPQANDMAGLGMMGLLAQIQQSLGQRSPGSSATGKVGGGGPQQDGGLINQMNPFGGKNVVNGGSPSPDDLWW